MDDLTIELVSDVLLVIIMIVVLPPVLILTTKYLDAYWDICDEFIGKMFRK